MSKEKEVEKKENPEIPEENGDITPKEPEAKESRFKPMINKAKTFVKRVAKPFAVGAAVGGALVMFINGARNGNSEDPEDAGDVTVYNVDDLDEDSVTFDPDDEGPTE